MEHGVSADLLVWRCPLCNHQCGRLPDPVELSGIDGMPWDTGATCTRCKLENLGFEVRTGEGNPAPYEVKTAGGEWKHWAEVLVP